MKAMIVDRFGAADVFHWDEWPTPAPAAGEVRIRIDAVSINPVDWKMRRGLLDVPLPAVLGRDVCGVIDAAGDGVTGFAVGDEVIGVLIGPRSNGAYAQFVTTPTPFVGRKPAGMTRAQAATLGVAGLTAYRAVSGTAPIPSGAPVLVTGAAGGVGSFAVPLLRRAGAAAIIATAGSTASERYLIDTLGIEPRHVVRYPGRPVAELARSIMDLTGGEGVAAAFDFAGGPMKALCFEAIGFDGHVVSIVEEGPDFDLDPWSVGGPLFKRSASYHLVALSARSRTGTARDHAIYRRWIDDWLSLVSSGSIPMPPVIDGGPLTPANLARAHEQLEAHRVKGKLVLTVEH